MKCTHVRRIQKYRNKSPISRQNCDLIWNSNRKTEIKRATIRLISKWLPNQWSIVLWLNIAFGWHSLDRSIALQVLFSLFYYYCDRTKAFVFVFVNNQSPAEMFALSIIGFLISFSIQLVRQWDEDIWLCLWLYCLLVWWSITISRIRQIMKNLYYAQNRR